jgi:hypothetical protein
MTFLPMDYRVIQEFALKGDPPTQDRLDRLRERLTAAAPSASIELGVGRMLVQMTVAAPDPEGAVERARETAAGVIGGRASRAEVAT